MIRQPSFWVAAAAHAEQKRGSLEPGKYADLVVLDRDIMTVPAAEILKAQVVYTVVGGEIVYCGKDGKAPPR